MRAVVFVCCILVALSAPAASEECALASSCIHPVPSEAPPRFSADEILKMIQCHLTCISEQPINVQVNDCTLGCMTRHRKPELPVNRCRDECVSECESSANPYSECNRTCRRTFCRFGCSMHDSHSSLQRETIPVPIAAPVITRHVNSTNTGKLFVVNATDAMPSTQAGGSDENHHSAQNVSYLYKVQQGNNISYIWQKDIAMPLDLSAFACGQIQVSFAVVTQQERSEFSPTHSLCVDGVGGWPSNVDETTISASYREDLREGYLGYSVANISWTRPQNYQYLTSYTVNILTKTRSCGGVNIKHTYNYIKKDAMWFVISAQDLNGLLLFGCSYTLSIVSMPERPNQSRITKVIAPELTEQDPEISLQCRRVWDKRGFMNISVDWSLSSPLPLPAIRRFSVVPLLIDSSRSGLFGRIHQYPRHRINTQTNTINYSVLLTNFSPQRIPHYEYKIEVRVERNGQYLWRRVPSMKTCRVSAESNPPSTMKDITANNVRIQEETGEQSLRLQFNLSWSPPSIANGVLTEYELFVGTGRTTTGSTMLLNRTTFPEGQLSALINISFPHNTSVHCLHMTMRSTNGYAWSDWSESEIIALDDNCHSTSNTSLEEDSVSILYQRVGEEAVRVAKLSCGRLPDSTPDNISDKLYSLEQKLDTLSDMIRLQNSTNRLTERLRSLEHKIDQVINAVTQSSTGE